MRILLVCDSTYYKSSGGRVTRYLNKILKNNNHEVKMIVVSEKRDDTDWDPFYNENDIVFIPIRNKLRYKLANLLIRTKEVEIFKESLKTFLPEVVHFASFDIGKPAQFINESKKIGAKVVLQPWIMSFYCAQGYGFRNNMPCTLCANGNYLHALKNKCIPFKGIFSLLKRRYLQNASKKADAFLSSNSELDQILLKYGVNKNKILRFPVPFDYTSLKPIEEENNDYFIFYGQPIASKGINVLLDVFNNNVNQLLKIYPSPSLPIDTIKSNNIEIINGINWTNGLGDAIALSKVVLIPTLWATTIEYALYEAMLFKKPIILFNVGAHKDIFKNKFNALVVEPNDFEYFAKCIIELDENAKLRKSIGDNGYKTLLKINNPNKLLAELLEAYTKKTT